MLRKTMFLSIVFVVISVMCANAQESQNNFQFKMGMNFPNGDYQEDVKIGYNFGLKYENPMKDWFALFYEVNTYFNNSEIDVPDGTTVTEKPMFINFPLATGVSFKHDFGNIGIFGNLGGTLNILKITDFETDAGNVEYEPAGSFGGLFEAGLESDKFAGSIRLDSFGEHEVEAKSNNESREFIEDISMVTLNFAFKF